MLNTVQRSIAALAFTAVVAANASFALLGASFDYPAILQELDAMTRFQANAGVIGAEFALLAFSAALLAPLALLLHRRTAWLGVAAAVVQVVGLLRWPLVVPHLTDRATFDTLNLVLGVVIGETLGYLLTAAWTVAIVRALRIAPWLGLPAAVMIAAGVLTPFDVPGADQINFVGYLVWSVWVVLIGVRSLGREDRTEPVDLVA
ncbi:DUF4386 domain-containing protein [Lentzea sp. NPDC051838]|uniref:DUF4386 domain-containing protein n=1 Tax=Lentzea sp. NPDC051838 TaxID=3154849 RepID=UPI003422B4F9